MPEERGGAIALSPRNFIDPRVPWDSMTHYVTAKGTEANDSVDRFTFDSSGFGATAVQPNWFRWVLSSQVDSQGGVNVDQDGEYPTNARPIALVDLSAAISHQLGRQIGQNQTFRVNYLSVSIHNRDDTLDNKESALFAGRIRWYSPTHHRVEAYKMYRDSWRHYYKGSTNSMVFDSAGDATGGGDYRGLRVGLLNPSQMDGGHTGEQVPYQSTDPFTDIEGSFPCLNAIFNAYDQIVEPGDVDRKPGNALWTSGRTGYPDGITFQASMKNSAASGVGAAHEQFQWNGDADVMCGLLALDIGHSSTDDGFVFEDEYYVRIDVGIDGWGGDF